MRYLLMIFDDPSAWADVGSSEMDRVMATHERLARDLKAAGQWVECQRLRPSTEAITLRVQRGEPVATDGPFAETKEVMGGYYVIECGSKREALEWAKRLPLDGRSSVEIREIWQE